MTNTYCRTHQVSLRYTKGWCPACAMATELHTAAVCEREATRWAKQAEKHKTDPYRYEDYKQIAAEAHDEMLQANSRALQCRESYEALLTMGDNRCPCDDAARVEDERTQHEDERLRLIGVER